VAFDVSNLSKARTFYDGFLGFEEYGVLRRKNGSVQMAFIKINGFQHLEVFVAQPPPGRGRLNHVAFYTDNAEQMREYLASRGVKVPERVGRGRTGDLNFMIRDPDGNAIEWVQAGRS
jgi:catechol 2,3-dioxygenase-like lactoylglutathione lyase family enzyme